MRIVLDTNVLVRALVSARGPTAEVLRRTTQAHRLLLSWSLLDEVERVLAYPRLRKIARFATTDVERFLNLLIEAGEVVYPVADTAVPVSDPDDIAILQTAAAGKAAVICTLDRHLFQPEVVAWCQELGIRVERDVEIATTAVRAGHRSPTPGTLRFPDATRARRAPVAMYLLYRKRKFVSVS